MAPQCGVEGNHSLGQAQGFTRLVVPGSEDALEGIVHAGTLREVRPSLVEVPAGMAAPGGVP